MLPADPTSTPAPDAAAHSLSLRTYLHVIRRQRRLIVIVTLLTAILGALPAILADSSYASTARVRVSPLDQNSVFEPGTSDGGVTEGAIEMVTEMELLGTDSMRSAVISNLPGDVPEFEDPDITQVGFTRVVSIKITADDPTTAADVANAYANTFIEDRQRRAVETLNNRADQLRDSSAEARAELIRITEALLNPELAPSEASTLNLSRLTLESRVAENDRLAEQLSVEASLRGDATTLSEPAVVELDPIRPSPITSALLGFTLGLLLSLAIAVVADTVQDKLGSRDDLAGVRPDVPVLAVVPHSEFDAGLGATTFAAQEAYRYLRTGLRVSGLSTPIRSVLVTSAVSNEGKTTTAANLALVMAATGDRVVLVDCDLRRPTIHEHFGVSNDQGLSSLIVGDSSLDEVTHFVHDNLAVITAGPGVQNPTELLGSEQFARALAAIVDQADFTILDSPPVLPVADALIAGQLVDGVIGVSRIGAVRRRAVREMTRRVENAHIPLIGLVANDTAVDEAPYGYYYYEGAAGKAPDGKSDDGKTAERGTEPVTTV